MSQIVLASFDPRCHGLCGSQKYTATPVSTLNWTMLHLALGDEWGRLHVATSFGPKLCDASLAQGGSRPAQRTGARRR